LIITLCDGYDKRLLDKTDVWLLFAKTDQLVPLAFSDYGTLSAEVRVARDRALAKLTDYLEKQTADAYRIIDSYLKTNAKVKKLEGVFSKLRASPRTSKPELDGVNKDLTRFRKENDEQSEAVLHHCQQMRACLRENNPKEFDEAALQQFAESKGQISATGLAELHTWLRI
jgi:hypothetical protein